jgi:hypothetical protein
VVEVLGALLAVVWVRVQDMAVLWVANGVGLRALAQGVHFEAPFATAEAVAVEVVARFHADEAVVVSLFAGLEITVFILDELNLSCQRGIGPCARSWCSFERGNRERGR